MSYQWTAHKKDQTYLPQFTPDGKENNFKLVLDVEKDDQLAMLHVSSGKNNFAVDLETGIFYMDNIAIDLIPEWRKEKKHRGIIVQKKFLPDNPDFRIIFYRRMREQRGADAKPKHLYVVILGWQITIGGLNYQRIMFIYPSKNGNSTIEFREKR